MSAAGAYGWLVGNDGDDIIYGGDNNKTTAVTYIYGDSLAYDDMPAMRGAEDDLQVYGANIIEKRSLLGDMYNQEVDEGYGELSWRRDSGDDLIKGGSKASGAVYIVGGYGNDTIFSGSEGGGAVELWGDNRAYTYGENAEYVGALDIYGREGDGDDIIDVEENYGQAIVVYGQGGNDKIIGSVQGAMGVTEKLFGGNGNDKIWAFNPGQFEPDVSIDGMQYIYGGIGKDIIYGSNRGDKIYGDMSNNENDGDDDIIYSGINDMIADPTAPVGGDYIYGGGGDDKIYGQG